MHSVLDGRGVHVHHFADKTEIHLLRALGLQRQFFSDEHGLAVDADGASAEFHDARGDVRIDHAVEHALDDGDRLGIGDAQAVHEARLLSRVAHPLRDGLAAAVDDDGIDANCFEEDDVAQQAVHHGVILHRAAAVFDHEELAAELLDVGQGFDEGLDAGLDADGHLRDF